MRRAPVSLAFTLIVFTLTLSGCYGGSRPPRIGTPAPDFIVQDADRRVEIRDFRGKIVLLNFWATWCAPCVEEMPSLVQLQQRLKDKGVTVVAVSVDVDDDAYHNFLKDHKIDLLTVRDPDQKSKQSLRHLQVPRNLHHRPQRHRAPQVHWRSRLEPARDRGFPQQTVIGNGRCLPVG